MKTKNQTLSEYLGAYLDHEYMNQNDSEVFWNWLPDIIEEGIQSYDGGAFEVEDTKEQ